MPPSNYAGISAQDFSKFMDTGASGTGKSVPRDSKKRDKFKDLAEKRTNKALETIRLIGNLSNRNSYAYEETEVKKIVKALKDAVSEVEARFNTPSGRSGGEFRL
jgi:hypothetical protein